MDNVDTSDSTDNELYEAEELITYFCRLTFGQFFTLIVLLVLTVGSAFYLGARYGNQYLRLDGAPNDSVATPQVLQPLPEAPRKPLPEDLSRDTELKRLARKALRVQEQKRLERKVHNYLETPPPPVSNKGSDHEENAANVHNVVGYPSQSAPVSDGLSAPAATPLPGLPPEPDLPLKQANNDGATTVSPITSIGGASGMPYSVQIGAYRDIREASAHVEAWKNQGYPAYMLEADIPNKGRWYRVRIGAFATRTEANSYLQDLKSKTAVEGIVVER